MISHEMVGVQKLEYNFGIISTKLQYGMNVGKLEINHGYPDSTIIKRRQHQLGRMADFPPAVIFSVFDL